MLRRRPLGALVIACGLLAAAAGCRSAARDPGPDAALLSGSLDAPTDPSPAEVDPHKTCQSSDECVLVNWGCCPKDLCSPTFTVAVNRASEASVHRVSGCGVVCSVPAPCDFALSPSCDDHVCTLHCSGNCPPSTDGGTDGTVTASPTDATTSDSAP